MMVKIINNDILEEIDHLDNDFDICFTSPPYNLKKQNFSWSKEDYKNKNWKKDNASFKNDQHKYQNGFSDDNSNYVEWLYEIITKLLKKCKYFFLNVQSLGPNKKDLIELQYKLKDYYCDTIIWNKTHGVPNGLNERVMTNVYEYIHIYSLNPTRAVGTKKWRATVSNLITIKGNQQNKYSKIHKAMFPLELAEWIVCNFVKEGGKVLDCFGGLGTTMVACRKHDRNGVMVEINKDFCEKAKERIYND